MNNHSIGVHIEDVHAVVEAWIASLHVRIIDEVLRFDKKRQPSKAVD